VTEPNAGQQNNHRSHTRHYHTFHRQDSSEMVKLVIEHDTAMIVPTGTVDATGIANVDQKFQANARSCLRAQDIC
jgi:hypothetical protein